MRFAALILIAACSLPTLAGCGTATGVAPVSREARRAPVLSGARNVPKPVKTAAPTPSRGAQAFVTQVGGKAPAFSPSGDQLIFETPRGLMAAQPTGLGHRAIPNTRADDAHPAFAPDGRTVAFIRRNGTRSSALMRLQAATGQVAPIFETPEAIEAVTWAPDGRALVYLASQNGQTTLYRLPVPGNTPARLWQGTTAAGLTVSSTGTIVFGTTDASGQSSLVRLPIGGGTAERLDVAGTNPRYPSFSPTGRSIAYVADGGIYIAQANGMGGQRVASAEAVGAPAWNPKASQLMLGAPRGTGSDLQLIELPRR